MGSKIIITGAPGCGKSTLISLLIKFYTYKNYRIYGFLSPEIRENNKRIGFDIENINTQKRFPLARIGKFNTNFKVGKYSVFIREFEIYLDFFFEFDTHLADLIIIDEIGKMELLSKKFQDLIKIFFQSETSIIASIGQNFINRIKNSTLLNPNHRIFTLNRKNQKETFNKIITII